MAAALLAAVRGSVTREYLTATSSRRRACPPGYIPAGLTGPDLPPADQVSERFLLSALAAGM